MLLSNGGVSILLPTYNRAHLLRHALRGALAQTHSDIEVIVLDDASPDDTALVVDEFRADPRVRYVRHSQNLGIVNNWRFGVGLVTTRPFFCILHDDDTFEPDFVAELVHALNRFPQAAYAFCDHWVMTQEGVRDPEASDASSRRFRRTGLSPGIVRDLPEVVIVDFSVPIGASLFRRDAVSVDMLNDAAKGSIDYWLLYQLLCRGSDACYVPKRLMNYRAHGGGMSQGMSRSMIDGMLFRDREILRGGQFSHLEPRVRRRMCQTMTHLAVELVATGRRKDARSMAFEALRHHVSAKPLMAAGLALCGALGTQLARHAPGSRRTSLERA